MGRSPPGVLLLSVLLLASCDDGDSPTVGPATVADCGPQTVSWEIGADGTATPALPDDEASLVAAVAATFCASAWTEVSPDSTDPPSAVRPVRPVLPRDDAACVADRLVSSLGAARTAQLGLGAWPWTLLGFGLSNNFGERQTDRAEAESIVEAFTACSEHWKLLLILSVTEGADQIGDESAACVEDRLADDDAHEMLVGELDRAYDDPMQPDARSFPDLIQPLIAAFDECLTDGELANLDFD